MMKLIGLTLPDFVKCFGLLVGGAPSIVIWFETSLIKISWKTCYLHLRVGGVLYLTTSNGVASFHRCYPFCGVSNRNFSSAEGHFIPIYRSWKQNNYREIWKRYLVGEIQVGKGSAKRWVMNFSRGFHDNIVIISDFDVHIVWNFLLLYI